MTKYSFLVYHKQYLEFLEQIKEIGILHVIEKPEGIAENDALREKMQMASRIKSALKKLELNRPKDAILALLDANRDGLAVLEEVENVLNEKEHLQQRLAQTDKERDRMEVWGNFSREQMEKLREAGFVLNFFSTPLRKFDQEWEISYNAFEISRTGNTIYFVTVTHPEAIIEIDADRIVLSQKTVTELDAEIANIHEQISTLTKEIERRAVNEYNTLKELEAQTLTAVAFDKALLSTHSEADDKVKLLEGWCPEGSEEALNVYLQKSDIYYETNNPQENEKVPIKLKNNKFAQLFEPITKMFSLPNYSEIDPTPLFAPFFMLFFGLCFADAGYGLLLFLVATIVKGKLNPDMRPLVSLVQWLGVSAFVVGLLLTGTFFGIELVKVPVLEPIKDYFFSQEGLMQLALGLGMFHIVFGKVVAACKVMKQKGLKYSIAHWAWVFVITSFLIMFAPAVLSMFGNPLHIPLSQTANRILYGVTIVSALAILFYNSPEKNIFNNIGSALWNSYNVIVGMLSDTLSYIRLFAIGLAGGILGGVFNLLAIELTADLFIVARIPLMLLILLVGHGMNIALGLIASVVHPLRLVFVEYFKNSEYEGGGVAYTPFEKVQKLNN